MLRKYLAILIILVGSYALRAQSEACPCCSENHKAFDFWIGTWEVTLTDGTLAGKNVIEKVQDGCILRENWTSAKTKFTGTSTNFYNLETAQ